MRVERWVFWVRWVCRVCWVSGYISESTHLDDFDMIFCAAPTSTASMRGVVPSATATGFQKPGARMSEKNAARGGERCGVRGERREM